MQNLRQIIEDAKEELKKQCSEYIQTEYKKIFEKYPKLISFSAHGYVPGFNDGDPCTFSFSGGDDVHIVYSEWSDIIQEHFGYCEDYNSKEDWIEDGKEKVSYCECNYYSDNYPDCEETNMIKDIVDFLNELEEDCINWIYGDNFELVFTRDGIEVNDYCCGY